MVQDGFHLFNIGLWLHAKKINQCIQGAIQAMQGQEYGKYIHTQREFLKEGARAPVV